MSSHSDSFQKFLFTDLQVRGEWVRMEHSLAEAIGNKSYPKQVRSVLAQTAAASVLLTGTLKFEGILSIHARGNGPVSLLMAECNDKKQFRCLASYEDGPELEISQPLSGLLGQAQLAITIDPSKGQRYQGIVPLERANMSDCLEHYFELSEQLDTYINFFVTDQAVYALMLQKLPDYKSIADQDAWARLQQLAETLKTEEFEQEGNDVLTMRLFHEENVELFEPERVSFQCTCSKERSLASLQALGEAESLSILEEQAVISIDCQFCGAHYEFDRSDINKLFGLGQTH